MSVEVPARVVFINIKDGSAFFDCTPAEARMAVKAVKHYRSGKAIDILRNDIEIIRRRAEKAPVNDEIITGGISANHFADGFACLEKDDFLVSHAFLGARTYADMRMWGKESPYRPETDMDIVRGGIFGYVWTCAIVVTVTNMPEGSIVFRGVKGDEDRFHRYQFTIDPTMPRPIPRDERMEEKMDRVLALINK